MARPTGQEGTEGGKKKRRGGGAFLPFGLKSLGKKRGIPLKKNPGFLKINRKGGLIRIKYPTSPILGKERGDERIKNPPKKPGKKGARVGVFWGRKAGENGSRGGVQSGENESSRGKEFSGLGFISGGPLKGGRKKRL